MEAELKDLKENEKDLLDINDALKYSKDEKDQQIDDLSTQHTALKHENLQIKKELIA